ncbi:MAG: radical SAM family heme chaperone HemW [Treponema sp.]|nr:radical SAM family heme chaperone HemW [Treponema sp.]
MDYKLEGRKLGLYIHIPFCLSKCTYCDFFSIESKKKVPQSYLTALCNEISFLFQNSKASNVKIDTIYIGGGTPSLLSLQQIEFLTSFLFNELPILPDYEFTIEVNPDDLNLPLLEKLWTCGINRISCGIQSFNDASLTFCHRRANSSTNQKALTLLASKWPGLLSLDFISAMPNENQASFLSGLKELISSNPDHLSMYSLTIEEKTPLGKLLDSGSLQYDFEAADEMWLKGRDFLEENGYREYEVSNFCKSGKECRHNMKYWSRGDYVGCGAGATGTIYFEGGAALRRTNLNDISLYSDYWNKTKSDLSLHVELPYYFEEIEAEEGELEFYMMALRKLDGFSESEYEKHFNRKLPEKILSLFEKWQSKGLAKIEKNNNDILYSLGKEGIIYLNSFLKELL